MEFGLAVPTYGSEEWRIPPDRLLRLARRAEETGFAGLWFTEHLCRRPDRGYSRMAPISALATVAGATETIDLGTSVLLLPLRNPVLVAQHVSTIHYLSGYRLQLGLGAGWLDAEFEAVGVPYAERGARFTEGVDLLQRLLVEDAVTFDGEYYQVEEFRLEPKVDRPPHFLMPGSGTERDGRRRVPRVVKERIRRFGDGWIGASRGPAAATGDWADISDHLEAGGDDPGTYDTLAIAKIHLVPGVDSDVAIEQQRKVIARFVGADAVEETFDRSLTGSVEDVREQLRIYRENGFDQIILSPLTTRPGELDRQLEYYSEYLL